MEGIHSRQRMMSPTLWWKYIFMLGRYLWGDVRQMGSKAEPVAEQNAKKDAHSAMEGCSWHRATKVDSTSGHWLGPSLHVSQLGMAWLPQASRMRARVGRVVGRLQGPGAGGGEGVEGKPSGMRQVTSQQLL